MVYLICPDETQFDEAEKVMVDEFGWRKHQTIDQYFGPNEGESLYCMRGESKAQVCIPPMDPRDPRTPLPKSEVPGAFNRLYETLNPTRIEDDFGNQIELTQLIKD